MHEVRELNRRKYMDQDVVFTGIQRANLPKRDGGCDVLVT